MDNVLFQIRQMSQLAQTVLDKILFVEHQTFGVDTHHDLLLQSKKMLIRTFEKTKKLSSAALTKTRICCGETNSAKTVMFTLIMETHTIKIGGYCAQMNYLLNKHS